MVSGAEKVAVVTGSTQGLGEAIARRLVDEGLIGGLVICGRSAENGERLAREFSARGCRTEFVRADLAVVEDCRRVIEVARRAFNRIDILVNSAATSERGTILDTTPELFDRIMAINLRAPFFLMQGAIQTMVDRGIAGTILNILSMSSHGGQPFLSPYSTARAKMQYRRNLTGPATIGCRRPRRNSRSADS
jgi:NAD(P)-dependent dehydrogenase (short-subunit alcohol dehydrogenase family)